MRGPKPGSKKDSDAAYEREQGFNTYYSGANRDRAAEKDKELKERSRSRNKHHSKERKGWNDKPAYGMNENGGYREKLPQRESNDRYSHHTDEEYEENHDRPHNLPPSNQWAKRRTDNQPSKNATTMQPNLNPQHLKQQRPEPTRSLGYTIDLQGQPKVNKQEFLETGNLARDNDEEEDYEELKNSIQFLNDREIDYLRESLYSGNQREGFAKANTNAEPLANEVVLL